MLSAVVTRTRSVGTHSLRWYLNQLETRPFFTNSWSTAGLYLLGDALCQKIDRWYDPEKAKQRWDFARNARFFIYGGLIIGPASVFWYKWLDGARLAAKWAQRGWPKGRGATALYKVFLDEAPEERVLWEGSGVCLVASQESPSDSLLRHIASFKLFSPVCCTLFFTTVTAMEFCPPAEIWGKLRKDFVPTLIKDFIFWPPVQLISFYYLPAQYRVLWVAGGSIVWNTYLSFVQNADASSRHPGASS